MSTSVKALLDIMSIRLRMYDDGITVPHASVRFATRALVEKLCVLDQSEKIEIAILSREPLQAQYVRVKTGEILASIDE